MSMKKWRKNIFEKIFRRSFCIMIVIFSTRLAWELFLTNSYLKKEQKNMKIIDFFQRNEALSDISWNNISWYFSSWSKNDETFQFVISTFTFHTEIFVLMAEPKVSTRFQKKFESWLNYFWCSLFFTAWILIMMLYSNVDFILVI